MTQVIKDLKDFLRKHGYGQKVAELDYQREQALIDIRIEYERDIADIEARYKWDLSDLERRVSADNTKSQQSTLEDVQQIKFEIGTIDNPLLGNYIVKFRDFLSKNE